MLRRHILNLMTRFETSWERPELKTAHLDTLSASLAEPLRDGLIRLEEASCGINESGIPFLRNICMAFDARLVRKSPETRLFSQTV